MGKQKSGIKWSKKLGGIASGYIGNRHWKEIVHEEYTEEVAEGIYETRTVAGFYHYGWFYRLECFRRTGKGSDLLEKGIHGYDTESYSGLVIRISDCGEAVQVFTSCKGA